MLSKRQEQLIKLLLQEREYQGVDYFANKLGVTSRTIYSDLERIEAYFEEDILLKRQRGKGILLETQDFNLLKRAKAMDELKQRRIYIMEQLLFEDGITYKQIADKFFISHTSIKNDLERIEAILSKGNDSRVLGTIQGTRLEGSLEDRRKAMIEFNQYVIESNHLSDSDPESQMKTLKKYYGQQLVSICSATLLEYIRNNLKMVADYYLANLLSALVVLVYTLQEQDAQRQALTNDTYQQASSNTQELLDILSRKLSLTYNEADLNFIQDYFKSNRFDAIQENQLTENFVQDLIEETSEVFDIDFSQDVQLIRQLQQHTPAMLFRLRHEIQLANPLLYEIKESFSNILNLLIISLTELEAAYDLSFNINEISLLALYFQVSIERQKLNQKILLICQTGFVTSELLYQRLKNLISVYDRIELVSVSDLAAIDLTDYDVIFSTVQLTPDQVGKAEVHQVSPFIEEEQLSKLLQASLVAKEEGVVLDLPHLARLLREDFIFLETAYRNRDELIEAVGAQLVEADLVQPAFIQTVKDRETISSTDFPAAIATPHGESAYVNRSVIAIIQNQQKFKWGNYFVDLVFYIAIANEERLEYRPVFKDIYQIINHSQLKQEFYKYSTAHQLLQALEKGGDK